jgi:hypothetical protein
MKLQYPYAVDGSDNLIHISSVNEDSRENTSYRCPNCGGLMLACLGSKNAHYFRHDDSDRKCGIESYVHKVAKDIIINRFNTPLAPFIVGFSPKRRCRTYDQCEYKDYHCELTPEYREYDLKTQYDLPAKAEVNCSDENGTFRPDVILRSSNPKRKPIFIEVYHKHKSSESKVDSGNYIIEIRIKTLDDLELLETGVLQESDEIRFLNFKHISVLPAEIENKIIEIGQENGLRFSEHVLPYCRKSIKGKREESIFGRLTLYKSGKTFRAGILENEINDHHQNALMDITYDIRSVPYDFDPHMVMAKLHIEARNCHLCDHCVRTEDVTWCNIVKNGSTRKGTFKVEKGQKCSFFQWHDWFNYLYESYSKDLIEGKDFHIWKNDR